MRFVPQLLSSHASSSRRGGFGLLRAALVAPVVLAGLVLGSVGCGDFASFEPNSPTASIAPPASGARSKDGPLTVATFNIQVYGVSKSKKPEVMRVLADVVRRFDVVAIQEIRSKDQSVLGKLVDLANEGGRAYDYVLGPRLGRTSSKEQYAYVYDTTRLEVVGNSTYTVPDRNDRLHREPLVTRFRAVGTDSPFTFTLVNVHTDPDEVAEEVDVLDDVFAFVHRTDTEEDDVIILGDLNADESRFGQLANLPNATWAVSGVTTNTRRTKTYDNIVFDGVATAEYTGRWGVLDLEEAYGLTREAALEVSDHLPVWAEFERTEAVTRIAGAVGGRN